MYNLKIYLCTICGEQRTRRNGWFLVAENRWEDKLTILRWSDELACAHGVHPACGPAHVQQMVIHWMTTGSVGYPFAQTRLPARTANRDWQLSPGDAVAYTGTARPLGELSIHRESIGRVLKENPQSLKTILAALCSSMQREPRNARAEFKAKEKLCFAVSQ